MRDTIDMLREAGWASYASQDERFKAFEALVRADQREIDAKVCEDGVQNASDWDSSYWDQACENRAVAIRARSEPVQDTEAHYKGVIEGVQKLFDKKRTQTPHAAPVEKYYVDGGHIVYPAAQRQWVGLTRDQVEELFWPWSKDTEYRIPLFEFRLVYSAIEAKLKEKNGLS
jgi:hypothetical protein